MNKQKCQPISIILTNRNTLEFLKLAIKSIRINSSNYEHELIIMDDNSNDGSKEWLRQNRNKYMYSYYTHDDKERHGIVGMVDEGIKITQNEIIYILHSDMYVAKNWDVNLIKYLKPKTIVCSTRIEPPGKHPPEMCKIQEPLGWFPNEFQEERFNAITEQMIKANNGRISKGVFAPTMCYKKDWISYDPLYYPQSIEDSSTWMRMKKLGYDFVQSWDSLVYHFMSRGSRYNNETKQTLNDSEEWKKTNKKNLKNFIRQYGNTPLYNEWKYPIIQPKAHISAHVLACEKDEHYVYNFLNMIEPYFEDIVFVFDSKEKNQSFENEVNRYCNDTCANKPTNFDRKKIKVFYHSLNENFAKQTNIAISKCSHRHVMKLDLDEEFNEQFLNNLSQCVKMMEETGIKVVGFPRINFLNGVVVNDVPRTEWTEDKLKYYEKPEENSHIEIKNPDFQFRLHTRNIQWIGDVHEVPRLVAENNEKLIMTSKLPFFHRKEITRQDEQNKFYEQINKKPIKKIMMDSVIFTTEGITEHARQEVKELHKKGYEIQLTDLYRYNEYIPDCEWFRELYKPFDITKKDYVVICNQPPERWSKTINFNKFIGYLAFEGQPPQNWVQIMNDKRVKEIWTPSSYCVKCFKDAGVQTPIYVIPHGVDKNVWKPLTIEKNEKFTFLWCGTLHNSRKGADILIKAFSEQFKDNKNVQLILKINNIYNPGFDADSYIQRYIVSNGNNQIGFVDSDMTEIELVEFMNKAHVFCMPSRSEGFGMIGLQALSCGIPLIATKATGQMEYCTEKNTYFIDIEKDEKWAPFIYPYLDAKWNEPSLESLKKQLQYVYDNYKECSEKALKNSEQIRKEHTWSMVVDKIEERLKNI